MAIIRRAKRQESAEKILDVDASMQGTMIFKDSVNLRINGKFEGRLDTKGNLTIGQNAEVKADINGENITIAGKVTGNITATDRLNIIPPAQVGGDIKTPILSVSEGAILNGRCQMAAASGWTATSAKSKGMTVDEVASYLEVESSLVEEWAIQKKIPAAKEANTWKFYKEDIDNWVAKEKVGR